MINCRQAKIATPLLAWRGVTSRDGATGWLFMIEGICRSNLNHHPVCAFGAAARLFIDGCALSGLHSQPLVARRGDLFETSQA
jgi:hypothetical protein